MMKKLLAFLMVTLLLAASACGNASSRQEDGTPSGTHATDPVPVETTAPEPPLPIVDENGTVIGELDRRSSFTAADKGIFYSIWEPRENQFSAPAEYHFFRYEDRKDLLLGTLADQGYEAFYTRTELNGIVYTLAVSGNPMDHEPDTLWLLAFDPLKETMSRFSVTEYGFPYAALTAANGKLWIMNHETDTEKADKIYEFDPESGTVREVLSYDGSAEKQGSLRSIYADEQTLYVLRLQNSGSGNELFLDSYDLEYRQITAKSLNDSLIPAGLTVHGMTGETDVRNEFGMMVSGFAVLDGRYLFYENFAILRAVMNLETGKTLFSGDDIYSLSKGGGKPAVYRLIFSRDELDLSGIFTLNDGKLEETVLNVSGGPSLIQSISRSPSGNWLIRLSEDRSSETQNTVLLFFHGE